jgi:peptidoglycan/LPS O-acetylase OafA/YrhL
MATSADAPSATTVFRAGGREKAANPHLPIAGAHVGALDGIRGAAILLVLWYHFGRSAIGLGFDSHALKLGAIGWVGVDLFFVLSGFLITGILYDSKSSEKFFGNFYARRALRIFPLYYGALAVVVILSFAWPSAGVWGTHSPAWIGLYLTNVLLAHEGPESVGILGHYWSLAIEEHFYLLWPLVVRWTTRRQLMVIACGIMVGALGLRIALTAAGTDAEAIYVLTPTRIDALAAGALCSLLIRAPDTAALAARGAWGVMLGGAAIIAFIILAERSLSNHTPLMQTIGFTVLAVTFAATIIATLNAPLLRNVAGSGFLRWMGRYSYGLYVWHPIVAVLLLYTPLRDVLGVEAGTASAAYLLLGAIALSFAVAVASYHVWEQPFLSLKGRFQ